MGDDGKKPGWKFWATMIVVVPVLYVASIGPVSFAIRRHWFPTALYGPVKAVYWPIKWIEGNGPLPIRAALGRYGRLWFTAFVVSALWQHVCTGSHEMLR